MAGFARPYELDDPFIKVGSARAIADKKGVRVRRKGAESIQPLDAGVKVDEASPWSGLPSLNFDGKSSVKLPAIDPTGGEPFSMTAWVNLPKIELHPGQTGGSLALVIAGQMTSGDSERTPPVAPTGWIFEIDEGVSRLRLVDGEGKVIRAQAPYHQPVKAGTWNHLTFTYDGSRTENGYAFYMNGSRMPIERGAYGAQDSTIAVELQGSIVNTAAVTIGASRNADKGIEGSIGDFRVFDRVISEEEARVVAAWPAIEAAASRDRSQLSGVEKQALKRYYLAHLDDS